MRITSTRVVKLAAPTPVYDLTVEEHHNFQLANGCFVHNSAKLACHNLFQEIYPIRGKIINAERATAKATANEEVQGIFALLGYNPSAPEGKDPLEKLRVSKIIFMADPDVDGPLPGDTELWVKLKDDEASPAILVTMKELASKEWRDRDFYVFTHDGQQMTWAPAHDCRVRDVCTEWRRLILDTGIEQECSLTHKWLVVRRAAPIGSTPELVVTADLRVGDRVCMRPVSRGSTGVVFSSSVTPRQPFREVAIESIESVQGDEPTPFYCLTVPVFHTFMLGNEMMSGNCHINSLLLTLMAKYAPSLFERGMIYIAHVDEFYAYDSKTDDLYTAATAPLLAEKLAKAGKRLTVNHIKGYGEVDPKELTKLCFDKGTRNLLRVIPEDPSMREFRLLMGNDAKVRREMIGVE